MRKSRKWREKRGERRKSPLIMRGPTKWVPNTNTVTGLLKSDKRFFQSGITRELKRTRNGVAVLWTHIDHKSISLEEEE